MCGIVGLVNPSTVFAEKFMTQALYADAVRGWHSTGIVKANGKSVDSYKRALPAADFIETKKFKSLMKGTVGDFYIGHNRAATIGAINDSTAHPFHHGDIIGVHNGTLDYGWKRKLIGSFDVDSEALIANIAHEGIEATAEKAEGAFAIVYYDMAEQTLNIVRNSERPMWYGKVSREKEDRWVYGSEAGLINWVTHRCDGYPLEELTELPVGQLLTFEADGSLSTKKIEVAKKSTFLMGYNSGKRGSPNANGASASVAKKANTTTTVQVNAATLEHETGFKHGDEVTFAITSVDKYSGKNNKATIEGVLLHEPFCAIRMYSAPADLDQSKEHEAPISRAVKKNGELELILNEKELFELDDLPVNGTSEDEEEDTKGGNIVPFVPTYKGPNSILLTKQEWDALAKEGCANCGTNVDVSQQDLIGWTRDNHPVCPDCINEPTIVYGGYLQ